MTTRLPRHPGRGAVHARGRDQHLFGSPLGVDSVDRRGAPVDRPETVATAIRIGNPASWQGAIAARDESGGLIEAVADEEILDAQREIAMLEGIFCEPASAAGVAGVRRLARDRRLDRFDVVVCVLTGHGLKDPDIMAGEEGSMIPVPAELGAIRSAMGL